MKEARNDYTVVGGMTVHRDCWCGQHRLVMWLVGIMVAVFVSRGGLAQQVAQTDGQQTEVTTQEHRGVKSAEGVEFDGEFLRVNEEDGEPVALQTAAVTYRGDEPEGIEVTLIGAIHVAEREYYHRLNELFRQFDALLYELVMDPAQGIPDPRERGLSPVSTIQVGMKEALGLSFQLDEIDYRAPNFVHADMTPQEFFETMDKRNEGVLQMMLRSIGASLAMQAQGQTNDLDVLAALFSRDRRKALRRVLAKQMETMDGQMAALTGEDGKSTLITERNAKAFEVLKKQIASGKKKIGIFYGAGHLKDMHRRLVEEFHMEPVKVQWLDAWSLR